MVELRNALQRELGDAMQLSNATLFDCTCVEDLARHIDGTAVFDNPQDFSQVTMSVPRSVPRSSWLEHLSHLGGEERRQAIKSKIRTEVAQVSGITDLRDEDQWGEAGLDSLSM
eukprot:1659859-Rhodomonas_salina.1